MSEAASRPFRRVGHKGADLLVAGNTVASFERAVEIGVEMVEFDVLRPAAGEDGSPLVIAHDHAAAAAGPRLTLGEALDAFTRPPLDRVEIDCDLKLPGREDELVAALAERGLIERAMVSTMYVESLEAIRRIEPALRLGWTYPKVSKPWDRRPWAKPAVVTAIALMRARLPRLIERRAPQIGAAAIWVVHPLVSPALVRSARRIGVELLAWTVDDADRVAELRAIGVDGIVSNDPRLLAAPASGAAAQPR